MAIKLSKEEMETHLYWSEEPGCMATVATFSTKLKRKLQAAAEQFPAQVRIISEDSYGELIAELPKSLISVNIKTPKDLKKKRVVTEEQKQAFVERTRKAK